MAAPVLEKVKIRGLTRIFSFLLAPWGAAVSAKAVYDLFWGEPEANLYSAQKWQFVTQAQWLRYGGFELVYGLSCVALAAAVYRYGRFLPEFVERPRREPDFKFFE